VRPSRTRRTTNRRPLPIFRHDTYVADRQSPTLPYPAARPPTGNQLWWILPVGSFFQNGGFCMCFVEFRTTTILTFPVSLSPLSSLPRWKRGERGSHGATRVSDLFFPRHPRSTAGPPLPSETPELSRSYRGAMVELSCSCPGAAAYISAAASVIASSRAPGGKWHA
jgi:hypothetical protein